jgi:hypothetical protein
MIISNDEARGTVEEKLRKQQRTKPMTEMEMTAFCRAMIKNLDLNDDRLSDIRRWTESWQSAYFRSQSGK